MFMKCLRKYGNRPYTIVLLHGGPGGGGEMRPVAEFLLSKGYSVLEPIIRKKTITGQIKLIKNLIDDETEKQVIIVGHSWGAMLGWLFCASYPEYVKKLIMVASGEFDKKFVPRIEKTRKDRMSNEQKIIFQNLIDKKLDVELFNQVGKFLMKIDSYDLIDDGFENEIEPDHNVFEAVWSEAEKLRESGEFLEIGKKINCPIVIIHGDYDPHPLEGIEGPIKEIVNEVKIYRLEKCGHYPWLEKEARSDFFDIFLKELRL